MLRPILPSAGPGTVQPSASPKVKKEVVHDRHLQSSHPRSPSHLMLSSYDPKTHSAPSRLMATLLTTALWTCRVTLCLCFRMSHTLRVAGDPHLGPSTINEGRRLCRLALPSATLQQELSTLGVEERKVREPAALAQQPLRQCSPPYLYANGRFNPSAAPRQAPPHRAVLSLEPVTHVEQSGDRHTLVTSSVCPSSVATRSSGTPHTLRWLVQK